MTGAGGKLTVGAASGSIAGMQEIRFAFGENWKAFGRVIDDGRLERAKDGLRRLLGDDLKGKPFFDIGCGSGLSMLAALDLGASEAHGIDIDPDSVAAAQALLSARAGRARWSVALRSVFDEPCNADRPLVYSWGVLHHTGDMWAALSRAAAMVAPGGVLCIALYQQTPLCQIWRGVKRIYCRAPIVQPAARAVFKAAYCAGLLATGRNPLAHIVGYGDRGMSWSHDVHDWLGGYPYESAAPDAVLARLEEMGFAARRIDGKSAGFGLFGSICAEFVSVRAARPDIAPQAGNRIPSHT